MHVTLVGFMHIECFSNL